MRTRQQIMALCLGALAAGCLPSSAAIQLLAGHDSNRTLGWETNTVGVIAALNGEANAGTYFSGTQLTRSGAVTSTDTSWGVFGSGASTATGAPQGSLKNNGGSVTQGVFVAVANNAFGSNLVLNAVHFDVNRGTMDMPVRFKLEYVTGDLDDAPGTVYDLTVATNEFMSVGGATSGDFDDVDWTLATQGTQSGTSASPTFNALGDVTLGFGEYAQFKITIIGNAGIAESLFLDNVAMTGEFVEAPLPPKTFATGTRIDTDFAATDSPAYANGDLAGQNEWAAITNSGANAFNVLSSGNGFAETLSAGFDTANGNQVVFDDGGNWTTNGIGSQWSGTIAFSFHTSSGTNLVKSREIAAGVTNTIAVADLNNRRVFNLGLTTDPDSVFAQGELDDVNINFHINGGEGLAVTFGGAGFGANQMLLIDRADLGWDPEWNAIEESGFATAGPDYDSAIMVCDYVIRKTTIADTYLAVVDVTIGGTTYQGKPVLLVKLLPYASDGVKLALGHDAEADLNGTFSRVDVKIDALSMTHSLFEEPLALAPFNMAASAGNLTADVSWAGAYEADSVELFRSENDGAGPYTSLTNALVFSYGDSGLTDKRTYFYTTVAHYGATSSPRSGQAVLRALGLAEAMAWGGSTDIVTTELGYAHSKTTTNGMVNYVSNGFAGSLVDNATVYNTNDNPLVYGISQHTDDGNAATDDRWSNVHKFRNATPSDEIRIDALLASTTHSALFWVQGNPVNAMVAATRYELTTQNNSGNARAAVRNGSTWYVSETTFPVGTGSIADLAQETWTVLTPATANSTSLMTISGASFSTRTLDNINAVGFFMDSISSAADKNVRYFGLIQSTPLTAYEQWADSQGIYNETAAVTNDADNDGYANLYEWALGGDPKNPVDVGIPASEFGFVRSGGNLNYIYPRLKSADRPTYTVVEKNNLAFDPAWVDNEGEHTITSGGTWPTDAAFEAVTNAVPSDDATKFLTLEISE